VYTNRFHYGAGIGIKYNLNSSISLDAGITYTFGETGAALPLDNITRSVGGDEINYANFQRVKTDMLLINAGIRINLFKRYTHKKSYTPSSTKTPTNTRYKDTTPTKTSDPAIPNKNTPRKNSQDGILGIITLYIRII
jgi:opacity protein-like surface antigen